MAETIKRSKGMTQFDKKLLVRDLAKRKSQAKKLSLRMRAQGDREGYLAFNKEYIAYRNSLDMVRAYLD